MLGNDYNNAVARAPYIQGQLRGTTVKHNGDC